MDDNEGEPEDDRALRAYWKANVTLIALLLIVWFVVSYGFGILFVESLNTWSIGSIPLGFWFAQQGSIFVFVLLIFVYAWGMDLLRDRYHESTGESGDDG